MRVALAQRLPRALMHAPLARGLRTSVATRGFFDRLIPEDDPELKAKKEVERKVLKERLQRSKFGEIFTVHKDKVSLAVDTLTAPAPDNAFPGLEGVVDIAGRGVFSLPDVFRRAPATLVTIAFQAHGQQQLQQWQGPFIDEFGPGSLVDAAAAAGDVAPEADRRGGGVVPAAPAPATPSAAGAQGIQLLNLVYMQGWLFKVMSGMMRSGVAKGLPPELTTCTGLVFSTSEQATDHFMDALKMHNSIMGYLFLVDRNGHVRWAAHGAPLVGELPAVEGSGKSRVDELGALFTATRTLLKYTK